MVADLQFKPKLLEPRSPLVFYTGTLWNRKRPYIAHFVVSDFGLPG